MQQKRHLQDTQRELEECYMVNDTTFDALERKTKIMENVTESAEEFQPVTTSQIDVVIAVDEITSLVANLGSLSSKEPTPRLRGLSVVTATPESPSESIDKTTASLLEQKYIVVAGYIRRVLPHLQAPFVKIPSSVSLTVLDYYHQSQLDGVLEDEELQKLSLDLVNRSDYEFLNFVDKLMKSKLKEQIWLKCDEQSSGVIDERRFMYFWIIPVTLFKVAEYQKENNTKEKPELDNADIKRECKHMASWIIWRYGTLSDGRFSFKLEQDGYHEKVTDYLQSYVDAQGKVRDRYDNI